MNDFRDFLKLLRYLLIFLVVVIGMGLFSRAHAADADWYEECWISPSPDEGSTLILGGSSSKLVNASKSACLNMFLSAIPDKYVPNGEKYNNKFPIGYFVKSKSLSLLTYKGCSTVDGRNVCSYAIQGNKGYDEFGTWRVITGAHFGLIHLYGPLTEPPKQPCETPKTDEQCKKGQRRQVTLPKSFWSQSTAEHKGCVISVESPGVGIANMDDNTATGHVNMMGSTGKSWCANTGTSDTTAQSIGASGQFTPTTTPKDCPKGSVTMGGQSWCYTGASDGVTKPDGSVPDDGIHDNGTSDDGNGGDVDSSIDREPGDGSGGDGGGGGGDGSGGGTGDGNGISKGDIKDGVKEGVEEALGKGSGAPAPMIPPSVEGVEGGINGVMSRYKQRINNAPISSAFNNISFSVPSAGCSPWGIHLDYLDVNLQFDQCAFLNSHSGMIGALMMAVFAGLSLVVFLKA